MRKELVMESLRSQDPRVRRAMFAAIYEILRWQGRKDILNRDVFDLAVRAVDTATDPGWRRRGLFSELTRQLVEEVRRDGTAFVFNTPGASSRPGYLKLGWQEVGRLPLLVRPLRSLASSWIPRSGRHGGPPPRCGPSPPGTGRPPW